MGCGGSKPKRTSQEAPQTTEAPPKEKPKPEPKLEEEEEEEDDDLEKLANGKISEEMMKEGFNRAGMMRDELEKLRPKPTYTYTGGGGHYVIEKWDTAVETNCGRSDFPTPEILREANLVWKESQSPRFRPTYYKPYPLYTFKDEAIEADRIRMIDQHAIQAPDSLHHGNVFELLDYLTKPCKNDLEKARVIFRWISAQDYTQIDQKKKMPITSPYTWLQLIAKMEAYDEVFMQFCSLLYIETKRVEGYLKTAEYEIGQTTEQLHKGYWSAVRLGRQWRLFHVHWALQRFSKDEADWLLVDKDGKAPSRPVKQKDSGPKVLQHDLDEFWFLTDPQQFVYSHLPTTGEKWQMLARPVTNREFTHIAHLQKDFFNLDLQLKSHPRCVLDAHNGECLLEFTLPDTEVRKFKYRLYLSSKDGGNLDGVTMERFVFMEQKSNLLRCRVVFPVKGDLKFQMFCRTPTQTTWKWVFDYVIKCEAPNTRFEPLPDKIGDYWGPNEKARELEVDPVTHPDGVVEAVNGMFQVRFKMDQRMEVWADMHNNKQAETELKPFIVHQKIDDEIIITGKVTKPGNNVLEITTKREGQSDHISSYLLTGDYTAFDTTPYPQSANRLIGATGANSKLQIEPLKHQFGIIQVPDNGEVDILMKTPAPCVLKCGLELNNNSMNGYTRLSQTENQAEFKVRIPKPGVYFFNISGKGTEAHDSFSNVYNYILEAALPKQRCFPFPETCSDWRPEFKIIQPTNKILQAGSSLPVTVEIPKVKEVAVIGSSKRTHLKRSNKDRITWTGDVITGNPGDDFLLAVVFKGEDSSFRNLLRYEIKERETFTKMIEEQTEEYQAALEKKQAQEEALQDRLDEFERAREELRSAIDNPDLEKLRLAIELVEDKRYIERLKDEIAEAKKLLDSIETIQKLKQMMADVDEGMLNGLVGTSSPAIMIRDVMTATFLVLGYHDNVVGV